ncbi:MAG: LysR family transcriptional regulator [Gemmatimonadaceae bacterium]|nr:LysR family transcriptional regulator [Gemmatimonadaceae bacterium]
MAGHDRGSEGPALNYHHLHYFWAVAHEGSVAGAVTRLGVAQATISEQLRELERALGVPLLVRRGRTLALTEQGHVVLRYADEIFSLGRDLVSAARTRIEGRPLRFTIGVADSLPKVTATRLLQPALALGPLWRVAVRTAPTPRLVADLAADAVDLVIADAPMPAGSRVRAYNHLLGESPIAVFAASRLAASLSPGFPRSLHRAPMLMPAEGSPLRRHVDAWCQAHAIEPDVVAEVDDMALLQLLGHDGVGAFCAPSVVTDEIERTFDVRALGRLRGARERFYAVSTERRIRHPAVLAIADAARARLAAARRPRGR